MMNKKLIALFVAIATVSAISADCYIDRNGVERCDGIVRSTTRDVVEGTGRATRNVLGGIGGVFTGESREEREERKRREHEERMARSQEREMIVPRD